MTRTFRVHFDGKVLVPEGQVDLPRDEPLLVAIEELPATEAPRRGTAAFLARERRGRGISDDDAERMNSAIEGACERTSTDSIVNFDSGSAGHGSSD